MLALFAINISLQLFTPPFMQVFSTHDDERVITYLLTKESICSKFKELHNISTKLEKNKTSHNQKVRNNELCNFCFCKLLRKCLTSRLIV